MDAASSLDRVRGLCLALPETSERLSHGRPWFFVRDRRAFASYAADFHGDGRASLWCDAPPGAQAALVGGDERFFVPPYVGYRGWLGVRLDVEPDWDEIAALIEQAHATAVAALSPRREARR